MSDPSDVPRNTNELPFVAPCRQVPLDAPLLWFRRGWQDLKAAPRQSITYGFAMVALSYLISAFAWWWGNLGLYLGLVSGFVFVGPWLALTLYSISIHVERGDTVTLRQGMQDAGAQVGNAMVFAVLLTVVFLVWARAATVLHVFFPELADPAWQDLVLFLSVGSAVGAVFCAIIFAASAFSLPMLMDREVDSVTAVVTSINAVLRNKAAMVVWAGLIGLCILAGLLTAYLAFAILLPLLGHATWHAYRYTIDSSDWPRAALTAERERQEQ
jgi:uncharacterized membrane protein